MHIEHLTATKRAILDIQNINIRHNKSLNAEDVDEGARTKALRKKSEIVL